MRIAILTKDYPPVPSGVGDYASHLSTALRSRGNEVSVLCDASIEVKDQHAHASIRNWDRSGINEITSVVSGSKPDVIIWQYNPFQFGRSGVGFSARRLARDLRRVAPLIIIAHELWYPWGRSGFKGAVWASSQRIQFASLLEFASKVVVTTPARKDSLQHWFRRRATDISYIPIGSNIVHRPINASDVVRARFGIASDAIVIGHFGSIGDGRDVRPLIDASKMLRQRDVHVLFVGRTGIDPPRVEGAHSTGPLDASLISEYLAACDLYAFIEPLGPTPRKGSLLAAMGAGLPIIALDGKNTDPIFATSMKLVPPGSFAKAVEELIDHPELRAALGVRAKELVQKEFSWSRIADDLLGLIGDLAKV
ncbi:MAG: glycosyltransferase family 4 protein [Actinomycetota bacterium]